MRPSIQVKSLKLLSILAFLMIGNNAFADEMALTSLSVWQNQRGSTLTIDSYDPNTGQMTGTYINKAAGTSCIGTPYAVVGYIYQDLIGWSVRWSNAQEDCQSITSWTGYYASGEITTDWNLVYGTQISAGSDTFTQVTKRMSKSLKAE